MIVKPPPADRLTTTEQSDVPDMRRGAMAEQPTGVTRGGNAFKPPELLDSEGHAPPPVNIPELVSRDPPRKHRAVHEIQPVNPVKVHVVASPTVNSEAQADVQSQPVTSAVRRAMHHDADDDDVAEFLASRSRFPTPKSTDGNPAFAEDTPQEGLHPNADITTTWATSHKFFMDQIRQLREVDMANATMAEEAVTLSKDNYTYLTNRMSDMANTQKQILRDIAELRQAQEEQKKFRLTWEAKFKELGTLTAQVAGIKDAITDFQQSLQAEPTIKPSPVTETKAEHPPISQISHAVTSAPLSSLSAYKTTKIKKVELPALPNKAAPGKDGGLLEDAITWHHWQRMASVSLHSAGVLTSLLQHPPHLDDPGYPHYQEMNAAAFKAIYTAADKQFHNRLGEVAEQEMSANMAWHILKKSYQKEGPFYHKILHDSLNKFTPVKGEEMDAYLARANQLYQTFSLLDVSITDDIFIRAILQGLIRYDGTWQHCAQQLHRELGSTPKWDSVKDYLAREDEDRISVYDAENSVSFPLGFRKTTGKVHQVAEVSTVAPPAAPAPGDLEQRLKELEGRIQKQVQKQMKEGNKNNWGQRNGDWRQPPYVPPNRRPQGQPQRTCWKCNDPGHLVGDCPFILPPAVSPSGGHMNNQPQQPQAAVAHNVTVQQAPILTTPQK